MTITLVLSEGPHDAAFLKRILMANGLKESKLPISDYPQPLGGYLIRLFDSSRFDGSTILNARIGFFFPSDALKHGDDELIVLFTTGGKDNDRVRKELVREFYTLMNSQVSQSKVKELKVKIVFNMDVDNGSIDDCEQLIHNELRTIIPNFPKVENMKWVNCDNLVFGLYLFMNPATGNGRLEDMVLPLIEESTPELYQHAKKYLDDASTINHPTAKGFLKDMEKSHIGTVGQLYHSGCANTTIIEKTPLINDDLIRQKSEYKSFVKYLLE